MPPLGTLNCVRGAKTHVAKSTATFVQDAYNLMGETDRAQALWGGIGRGHAAKAAEPEGGELDKQLMTVT